MAKDPAFLFYPGDFNTGTQFFSDDQVGKYMRLLMAQHQHGHLSEDQVIFICKSYDKHIMSKFTKDDAGLWFNERLEIEVKRRKTYVDSRSKNKEGKTKTKIISKSYVPHMETINEIENKASFKSNKDTIRNEIFGDEMFMDAIAMTHRGKDASQAFEECYIHHISDPNPPTEVSEWKKKLNTWLINTKNGKSTKATPTTTSPKQFGNANYKSGLR